MKPRRAITALLLAALVVGAGPAVYAAATTVPVTNEIPITTDQTPTIHIDAPNGADLNLTSYFNGSQLDIDTPDGDITVSGDSGANATIALADIEGTQTQATSIDAGSNWINLNPADKQRVDIRGDADTLSFKSIQPDDGTTDLQIGGTQGGAAEVRLYGLTAGETYALWDSSRSEALGVDTANSSGVLQTTVDLPDGTQALEVRTDGDFAAPTVSNPQPTGQITDQPDELSVDATLDTGKATLNWSLDGTQINSTTITSNGTYTVDPGELSLGKHTFEATITDSVNQSDTLTASFETPSKITFREEHNGTELINTTGSATVRFFSVDGEIAIERSITNGTVNLTGLPDSQFVATTEIDQHYPRTVFIESIFTQNTVYVLNSTAVPRDTNDAVRSRFIYKDVTGKFPRQETTVQLERALDPNGDGTSEFVVVAGDFWGASGEFEAILERNARYRLVLTNQQTGQTTFVGSHIPSQSLTQTVRTSGLTQEAANASGVTALADYNDSDSSIDIVYRDPADETEQLQIVVESQSGGTTLLDETVSGPLGTYSRSVDLNSSQVSKQWIVSFDAGDRLRSTQPVGSGSITLPVSVPSWVLTVLMTMAVTFVGALYGPRTALFGAWAMVFVAAGVAMFGWAFGGPSVLVAALVAVGVTLLDRVRP